MLAAQTTSRVKCCQVYPRLGKVGAKDTRDGGDGDGVGSRRGAEQVFAGDNNGGRHRRVLRRTTSWRYHPRPRGLTRSPRSHASDVGDATAAAAAATAAAAVPPSLIIPRHSSTDLLLLAAGVKRSGGSAVDRCTRKRAMSDSAALPLPSSPSSLAREICTQEQPPQDHHHLWAREQDLLHELGRQSFATADGNDRIIGEGDWAGCDDVCKSGGIIDQETQPIVSTPSAAKDTGDRRIFFPLFLKLGSRRRIRQREETSPISDSQDPMAVPSPPQSPPPGVEVPLLSTVRTSHGIKSKLGSSFRRRRRSAKSPRGTVRGRALAAAALAYGAILKPAQALSDMSLSFDPAVAGFATEISFTFTPEYPITEGKFIRLYLPGFTRGERNGTAGNDLGFNNEDGVGNDALVWPSDTFRGWWSEDTPENEFEDSLFNLYAVQALAADTPYTAIIDRSSSIKSNCGHAEVSSLLTEGIFRAWVDDDTTAYYFDSVQQIPMSCYLAQTSLTFDPPLPKTMTHITVAFQPARSLESGDTVTVNLKGFTSGAADGTVGSDMVPTLDTDDWNGQWDEGTYAEHEPGFDGSTLTLVATAAIPAGELHQVTVYRSSGIKAQCGMAENGASSTISVSSSRTPAWTSTAEFLFTQTMGPGCRELDYCSQRGECDYCLQRCNCPEGFGSLSEWEESPDIARDCSQMTCPKGVSWTPVLSGHPRPEPDASHTMAECSNMGRCIRDSGICLCEEGFEGRACERYACPNGCSGNGACRNMREMGLMSAAKPLVTADIAYGWASPEGSGTWDSRSMFGCVCDSSWEVGLGAGQTQQAEYFGPDCSLVHCPTGDDPDTDEDETDCEGVTAEGGQGVGAAGNLCHVDCSNRGICDFATGVCNCFDGYHGQACNKKHADGYGFNTDGK